MIIFKKVRWMNFISTGNIWTNVDLDKVSTTLIVGKNGSGKSTLIDAISFCLFNKPFRRINKPQLVNSITNKNCLVEVEFTLNLTNYKIVRGIKPAVFEIWQDDILLNQDAANKDYQEIVEKQILKINHKSFCQVVILGSSNYVPFMQLPAQVRREIIEDLLDLQIFTVMNSVLKQKIEVNDSDFWQTEQDNRLLTEKIKLIKQHIQSIQLDNQTVINQKLEQIDKNTSEHVYLNDQKVLIEKEVSQAQKELEKFGDQYEKLRELERLESQLEHKIDSTKKTIEFLQQQDQCPTCKQAINQKFRDKTIANKKKFGLELENSRHLIATKKSKIEDKIANVKLLTAKINDLKLQLAQKQTQMHSLTQNNQFILKEIEQIKSKQNQNNTQQIDQYQKQLDQLSIKYNELQQLRKIYDVLQFVLKDGGLKSKIIKQYVPIINKFINKYLVEMDFFVDFSLDENFEETIKSRNRDMFSYESFSEGEKARLNLAVLFAWRAIAKVRNSINTNLLIFDEVLDGSLDQQGTEEFLKIILQLTQDTNTFIISHHTDTLYDKFDRVLHFEKNKNFSQVREA